MLHKNISKTVVKTCEYNSCCKSGSRVLHKWLKSHNKTVIDFNFGRHKDLSTRKSDIHQGRKAEVNITLRGKSIIV